MQRRCKTPGKTLGRRSFHQRRVVITGLGLVTPLGVGVERNWSRLLAGACGVQRISSFATESLPVKIAASVPRGTQNGEFSPGDWVDKQDLNKVTPFMEFALSAAGQAFQDSGWSAKTEEEAYRAGVALGSGIGSPQTFADHNEILKTSGYRKISPFFVPKILINMASGLVSIKHNLKGPNHSCATACATGAHAIGDASRFIIFGDADVMLAGAAEASIDPLSIAGFARAKALATSFNDEPQHASRPFDINRDGFVIGEGAGAVVLEEYEHAKNRGAKIYAEIVGYGLSGDAFHITAPSSDGNGATRAMLSAIRQSGLNLNEFGYINAHATSTPLGDQIENDAIYRVFGEHSGHLAVSSSKGAIGHLLGAAGSVEAIFSILALQTGFLPPTINLDRPDPNFKYLFNYVPNVSQEKKLSAVLSNSFGFGGTNCSLAFRRV